VSYFLHMTFMQEISFYASYQQSTKVSNLNPIEAASFLWSFAE